MVWFTDCMGYVWNLRNANAFTLSSGDNGCWRLEARYYDHAVHLCRLPDVAQAKSLRIRLQRAIDSGKPYCLDAENIQQRLGEDQ